MDNQWSGGQYSLLRVVLGLLVVWHFLQVGSVGDPQPLAMEMLGSEYASVGRALGFVCALFFLLGKGDRIAAWILFFLVPLQMRDGLLTAFIHPYALAMGVHVFIAHSPYGSLAALGRPDPGENWRLPPHLYAMFWVVQVAMHVGALAGAIRGDVPALILAIAGGGVLACTLIFKQALRPIAWVLLAALLPVYHLQGSLSEVAPLLFLHLACFDPAWLPAHQGVKEHLFYDGNCGLCHRACRFVLAEDRDGERFVMAPLQGDLFASKVDSATQDALPDSLILRTEDGLLLTRSSAVLTIGMRLGGLWRPLAFLAVLIPRPLRDGVYSGIAAIRHRIFPKPDEACPVVPVHLRTRFDW